jgi:hypothetical protein
MASVDFRKISTIDSIGVGGTYHLRWNNPAWNTVLGFFAYPVPPAAHGEHGTSSGTVKIAKIECTHLRDNHNGDKTHVDLYIENTGSAVTGAEVYMSWLS